MTEAIIAACSVLASALIIVKMRAAHNDRIESKLIDRTLARENTATHQLGERTEQVLDLSKLVAQLQKDFAAVQVRVAELEATSQAQRMQIDGLLQERDGLKGQVSNLRQQRDLLQEQNEAIKKQNQALRELLASVESREAALRDELEDLRRSIHQHATPPPPNTTYLQGPKDAQ